ncbi:MAG: Ig-like domain-containing protein [Candidatus Pacebacteria bacterium]|jgi:hypothetical protein|nr:hypothetical protein [bacterium]MDP6527423.1 Ig-like domain-containing protein [Candidatus Paceibacterota bacterium]MDP6659670.1 Ig-like domain-containing protein [Candidatus Paceibacterota bacterium]|tara:strand:+ start:10317 stop:11267 length:951 start_codon:yes stop_codon:yes gene_type:complete
MRLTKFLPVLLLIITSVSVAHAININHVGFLQTSVWFEKEPFFAGETIRVYTALANSTEADVTGTVKFLSNGVEIGSGDVVLERQGGFQVIWTDWTPLAGTHTVTAKFVDVVTTEPGEAPQEIEYTGEVATAEVKNADTDTDGDGVGNSKDLDDDGDGLLDTEDPEPLIKAANPDEEEVEEENKESLANVEEAVEKITEVAGELAEDAIPVAKTTTQKVISTLEGIRIEKAGDVDEARSRLEEKLAEETSGVELPEGSEIDSTPFGQLRLVALTAASYTLNNAYAFYVALLIALYFIVWKSLKWIFRKMFSRGDDY